MGPFEKKPSHHENGLAYMTLALLALVSFVVGATLLSKCGQQSVQKWCPCDLKCECEGACGEACDCPYEKAGVLWHKTDKK